MRYASGMKTPVLTFLLVGALVAPVAYAQKAPPADLRAIKAALAEKLKDGESARVKDVAFAPKAGSTTGLWDMCGAVNAKNSYGGYAGFSRFYGVAGPSETRPGKFDYIVLTVDGELAETMCERAGL